MGRCLQQTWAVSILLCSIWSCRSCFEISTCGSEWIYTGFKTLQVQFGALFSFMILSECFQKHSLCSWVGMLWFHRSRKFFDLLEEYESNWDVFWIIRFDSCHCFVHLRCLWSLLITSCEYVRYSGIVRTMPTYLLWPLGIWSGSLFCDLLYLWLIADIWLWQ